MPLFLEARRFLHPQFRCLYFSQRLVCRAYVQSAGAALFPQQGGIRPKSVFPITDGDLLDAIGPRERLLNSTKALKRAGRILAALAVFLDREKVDALVVWNGTSSLTVSLAVWTAAQRRLPVVFVEHGYLPSTLQLDLDGVNAASSMTALAQRGAAMLPPDAHLDAQLDAAIAAYRAGRPTRVRNAQVPDALRRDGLAMAKRAATEWLKARSRIAVLRHGRRRGLDRDAALPTRFVLLPLQVSEDSQLLLHSPLLGNDLPRLIGLLRDAVQAVDPALRVVVKLHPHEKPRAQLRNLDLLRRYPDVIFLSEMPIPVLLAKADAVVTINSTVGFEALLIDKPVIALGLNFYTVEGIVHRVHALADLPAVLGRALEVPVDVERRRAFLRYVCAHFLTFGSYHELDDCSVAAVAARIAALLPAPPVMPDESHRRHDAAMACGARIPHHRA